MRNTNWIAFLKLTLVGFGIILLINCRKEEIPPNEVNDTTKTELRSSNPADSSLWDTLSYDRALDIFNDMKTNASGAWWQEFIENHGAIDWHLAMLSYSEGQDGYIASIPTQKNDTFSGLFLVRANSGQFDYKFVSAEDFNVSTDQLFSQHTEPYGAMAIVNGAMFNRVLKSNPVCNIEDHLADSTFISLMESIELRGWCLMEIILWEVDIPEVQRPTANKYVKLGQTIYLLQWGGGYTEIRKGISFTQEELDHNAQVDAWLAYIKRRKKATIQGQYNSEGYTVFRLWTWCGDDFDQNPWDYNWTTNTDEGGGGGTNTGTNWDYTSKRWYEEDNDCLSYFSISEGEERIKELEAKLIEESCGQAAAYMIKHNIDRIMNEKCDDQLHISGLPFPGNQINVNEMMDQILTEMNNHPYVILGRKICDICDDKANDFLKQQCYDEFLECSSAPSYEDCVEEKLCELYMAKPEWVRKTQTFKDCELLNCIYKSLEGSENLLWCETYEYFNYPPDDVILTVGGDLFEDDPFATNPDLNGATGLNKDGKLTVALNPQLCDVDDNTDILRRTKTLLHEGIHSRLQQYVIEHLEEHDPFYDISRRNVQESFAKLFELYCHADDGLSDQHEYMIDKYVNILAEALHMLNGGIGSREDYLYLAWLGLWKEDTACIEQKITESQFIALRGRYEQNVTLSEQLNSLRNGCD